MKNIEYSINYSNSNQILDHLQLCDHSFVPALSSTVNLKEYAKKVHEFSDTIEAWDEDILAGLIAIYINNNSTKIAHITNVSVLENYRGRGISSRLMEETIQCVRNKKFEHITLEVAEKSISAIGLYKKYGFVKTGVLKNKIKMIKTLDSNDS